MSEQPTPIEARPQLYENFDDAGRRWLDEVVKAFNDGGYTEAREALIADEAADVGDADR